MTKYDTPIIGKKYGQWTVVSGKVKRGGELNRDIKGRHLYWKVECNCGRESWRQAGLLVKGKTNSCKSCAKCPNDINTFINSYFKRCEERAYKSNIEFNITPEYISDLYKKQNHLCALSGIKLEFAPHYRKRSDQTASLDRIDNNKGYIKDNLHWVHKEVNFMKYKLSLDRFVELCNLISKC